MQQGIGLACALVVDPSLLFLDESFFAVDPMGRWEVRKLLRHLKRKAKRSSSIPICSKMGMEEDRIALLNNGAFCKKVPLSTFCIRNPLALSCQWIRAVFSSSANIYKREWKDILKSLKKIKTKYEIYNQK